MLRIKAPLHVSGIWIPKKGKSIVETGSIGAGLNLGLYLEASIKSINDKCCIYLNDEKVLGKHAKYLCRIIGNTCIEAYSPIGLGKGYGVSAALSIAFTLLSMLSRNKYTVMSKALRYAHIVEVEYSTGLGDVIAEYTGGYEIRLRPGAPGIGYAEKILLREKPCILALNLPGEYSTPNMLKNIPGEVYVYGEKLLDKLLDDPSLENFFEYSNMFTRRIFSYKQIDELVKHIRRGVIGYYRKKNSVLLWIEKEYIDEILETLHVKNIETHVTSISDNGVEIVYSPKSST